MSTYNGLSVENLAVSTIHLVSVLREGTVDRDQTPPLLRLGSSYLFTAPPHIPLRPPTGTLAY